MKYLLVVVVIGLQQINAQFGAPFPGFGPLGPLAPPLLPPRLVQPPTLQFQVPPGTCGLVCTVFDLLAVNPNFSTLVNAVKAAGLVERLSGPGPVTIFAPTNAAFDLVPPPKLQVRIAPCYQLLVFKNISRHS